MPDDRNAQEAELKAFRAALELAEKSTRQAAAAVKTFAKGAYGGVHTLLGPGGGDIAKGRRAARTRTSAAPVA